MMRAWLAAVLLGLPAIGCRRSAGLQACVAGANRQAAASTNSTLTAVPGIRVGHHTLERTADRLHGRARRRRCRRRRLAARRRPGHSRNRSARSAEHRSTRSTPSCCPAAARSGSMPRPGVVRWLEERGIGWPTAAGRVPIVTGAILFDLGVGSNPKIRPAADCGYRAAQGATDRTGRRGQRRRGRGRDGRQVRRRPADESRHRLRRASRCRTASSSRPSSR